MNFNTFSKEFKDNMNVWIKEMNKNETHFHIKEMEVTKNNDRDMHALLLTAEDIVAAPTIYIEDFYEKYQRGEKMKDLVREAIMAFAYGVFHQPKFADFDEKPETNRDSLMIKLLELDRNKKWLKDNMYMEIGNGLCLAIYVMQEDERNEVYGYPVTKKMAQEEGFDYDDIFETAILNTMRRLPPLLVEACEPALNEAKYRKSLNPFSEDFQFSPDEDMYLLTTQSAFNGSAALFYPQMMERIATLVGGNYYVLPSSVDELLIVPVGRGPEVEQIEKMVRQINRECVDAKDILSDRVFMYDVKRGELIEPPRPLAS